jgi:hypothetical protein
MDIGDHINDAALGGAEGFVYIRRTDLEFLRRGFLEAVHALQKIRSEFHGYDPPGLGDKDYPKFAQWALDTITRIKENTRGSG